MKVKDITLGDDISNRLTVCSKNNYVIESYAYKDAKSNKEVLERYRDRKVLSMRVISNDVTITLDMEHKE